MSRKQEKYEIIDIDSMAYEGVAIGRLDQKVYFIKNAVPGDKVKAQIRKSKKNYAEGTAVEIIEKSKHRIEPHCKYFGICGGCSWQNFDYEEQLYWKSVNVKDAFERIGKFSDFRIHPILKSDKTFNFRNKMEFTFGANRWLTEEEINSNQDIENKNFALGLHPLGRYEKVIDLEYCKIQDEYANQIMKFIKNKVLELRLEPYNIRTYEGFLRNIIIRYSATNDNFMVILVTQSIKNEAENDFVLWLQNQFKDTFTKVASLFIAFNDTNSPVNIQSYKLLFGNEYLIENILGVEFRISPFSFFQTNSYQLNNFIQKIIETTPITKDMIVWDLFCGSGSITLPAAKLCKKIYGIELSQSSIADANMNKVNNNITNAKFIEFDLNNKNIERQLNSLQSPDLLILDPPRAGLHNNLIEYLKTQNIPKIVYVSCNPSTQARDCDLLREKYNLISVQPVDMFPQTYHIENIALLELK